VFSEPTHTVCDAQMAFQLHSPGTEISWSDLAAVDYFFCGSQHFSRSFSYHHGKRKLLAFQKTCRHVVLYPRHEDVENVFPSHPFPNKIRRTWICLVADGRRCRILCSPHERIGYMLQVALSVWISVQRIVEIRRVERHVRYQCVLLLHANLVPRYSLECTRRNIHHRTIFVRSRM